MIETIGHYSLGICGNRTAGKCFEEGVRLVNEIADRKYNQDEVWASLRCGLSHTFTTNNDADPKTLPTFVLISKKPELHLHNVPVGGGPPGLTLVSPATSTAPTAESEARTAKYIHVQTLTKDVQTALSAFLQYVDEESFELTNVRKVAKHGFLKVVRK